MLKRKNKLTRFVALLVYSISIMAGMLCLSTNITYADSVQLYNNNFENTSIGQVPPDFSVHDGSWSVVTDATEGKVYKTNFGEVQNHSGITTVGNSVWQDYSVQCDVKRLTDPSSGWGTDSGLLGRWQDYDNYYQFVLLTLWNGEHKWYLGKKTGSVWTDLASENFNWTTDEWYTLKMKFVGSTIYCYINGRQVASVTDTSLRTGKVGFKAHDATSCFDNLVVSRETDLQFWTDISLNNSIFSDTLPPAVRSNSLKLYAPRNSYENGQIIVRPLTNQTNLRVVLSDLVREGGTERITDLQYNFVKYIYSSKNEPKGVPSERTRTKDPNWDNKYPDALIKDNSINISANTTQPIWITVFIPDNATDGIYTGKATIFSDQETSGVTINISLEVFPVTVPSLDNATYKWNQMWWGTGDHITYQYGVTLFDNNYYKILENMAKLMAKQRVNVIRLTERPIIFDRLQIDDNGNYIFNWENFDRVMNTFINNGALKYFSTGEMMGRYQSDWNDRMGIKVFKKNINGNIYEQWVEPQSAEANHHLDQTITQLRRHIAENWPSLLNRTYISTADESCTEQQALDDQWIANKIHTLFPEAKTFEASNTMNSMVGYWDVWSPMLEYYAKNKSFYDSRKASGDEIWNYTCLDPQGSYLNRFTDWPLLKPRLLSWYNFKNNVDGTLHWAINYWDSFDPFADLCPPGDDWPGDFWCTYPDKFKITGNTNDLNVLNTIRFDALRDGIEDLEVLRILNSLNPSKATQIVDSVVYDDSAVNYSRNHDYVFRKYRELLWNAGEECIKNGGVGNHHAPLEPWYVSAEGENGQIKVSFSAVDGATEYTVKYGTSSGNYTNSVKTTSTACVLTGLTNGLKYYITVVSNNSYGSSENSQEVSAVTGFSRQLLNHTFEGEQIGKFPQGFTAYETVSGRVQCDSMQNQVYKLQFTGATNTYGTIVTNGEPVSGDCSVQMMIKRHDDFLSPWGTASCMLAKFQDFDHFYQFSLETTFNGTRRWLLVKKIGNNWTTLASDNFNYNLNQWYKLKVEFVGSKISCYIDDIHVASVTDNTITSGHFGLRAHDATTSIDSLKVERLNLLDNATFESGVLSPWYSWNNGIVSSSESYSGIYCGRAGGTHGAVSQDVNVKPNTTYVLTGWLKVQNEGEQGQLGFSDVPAPSTTSTKYKKVHLLYTTGQSQTMLRVNLYKPSGGSGYLYGDDIELFER